MKVELEHVVEVMELDNEDDVNNYLKAGWKLLNVKIETVRGYAPEEIGDLAEDFFRGMSFNFPRSYNHLFREYPEHHKAFLKSLESERLSALYVLGKENK